MVLSKMNNHEHRTKQTYESYTFQPLMSFWLDIIISYPTSLSGIIVLLETPTKYRVLFLTLFVKTTDFQLVFNFEQTRTVTIFQLEGMV